MNLYQELFNEVKKYQSIVIFGHSSPDGDCYGSQIALKCFLKEAFPEKDIYMVGTGFLKAIPYFDKMDVISDEIIKDSLAIAVDCSDLERMEDQRITLAKKICKIDHHLGSEVNKFASINISNTNACSAAEMIGQFILENNYSISLECAERIFLGMVTDTGRFLFLNSSKDTFKVLDKIMEANIDFQKIYDFLYEGEEVSTRAKGYISYNFVAKENIAYLILDKETIHSLNIDFNYAASMVNVLSGMKGYPIWALFCESDEGLVRVELRSKTYNVQEVAIKFGGGGHLKASGCRLQSISECQKVIDVLLQISKGE